MKSAIETLCAAISRYTRAAMDHAISPLASVEDAKEAERALHDAINHYTCTILTQAKKNAEKSK